MAATLDRISPRTAPAEWDLLQPYDGERGTLYQVWMRDKGAAYWLMKAAVWLVNFVGRREARLRGRRWEEITNPHALEDGGIYQTREEAEDLCRIVRQMTGGRKAVTISPAVVGRAYPIERVRAAGDFDPFRAFDFSATDAVLSQARHALVPVDELARLRRRAERFIEKYETA